MSDFKSNLERRFHRNHPDILYEPTRFKYIQTHHYTPDFKVASNVFIEIKDRFDGAARSKHLYVRKQNPDLIVAFVFPNIHRKCTPNMTNLSWCIKNEFECFAETDTEGITAFINKHQRKNND